MMLPNVRYLSGFTGSNGAVLLSAERAVLFTDPRYATQAPLESDCEVKIGKGALVKEIAAQVKRLRLKSLAFESNRISYEEHAQLKEALPGIRLKALTGTVENAPHGEVRRGNRRHPGGGATEFRGA